MRPYHQPGLPPGALGDSCTRVLLGTLAGAYPTYDTIMAYSGLARSTIAGHMKRLRRCDLVAFEHHKQGTIRPLVEVVRAPIVKCGCRPGDGSEHCEWVELCYQAWQEGRLVHVRS